jgi:hypothetical protein
MADEWVNILNGFKEIFSAPFKDLSIWWLLAPIIMFWVILEIYFSRYKTEKLGWNSTLGYGLNMFWIGIISLRTLFANDFELFTLGKILFLAFIAMYSIFIISVSFTHKLKQKIFFLFASPTLVYFLSGIAVLWFNDLLKIHLWVVIDLIILYIIILILELILKKVIPSAPGESELEGMAIDDISFGNAQK